MAEHLKAPSMEPEQHGSTERPTGRGTALWPRVFVVVVMAALLVPFVGLAVRPTTTSAEKRELAAWPGLTTEDGKPNVAFLTQAGEWFSDHYAFRNELVDANAHLRSDLLGTSSATNVIVGTDGWLYYRGSVMDYQRTSRMSDRTVANAAHNLALMSEYAQSRGGRLVVAVAPDKTTLYPEHLPYYIQEGSGASNVERLQELLDGEGVTYVNLADILASHGGTLYRVQDTHWTSEGAAVAADSILDALGHAHEVYASSPTTTLRSVGDLAQMLWPLSAAYEEVPRYTDAWNFSYTNDATSPEDSTVQTASTAEDATGSLLMFRDSFGNALLPFMASSYQQADFSRLIPYNLGGMADGQDVVVLRAERHVASFATRPAYIPAPERDASALAGSTGLATQTTLAAQYNGPYLEVKGTVDPRYLPADGVVYVLVEGAGGTRAFECYSVSSSEGQVADAEGAGDADPAFQGDSGYLAYLLTEDYPQGSGSVTVHVLVRGSAGVSEVMAQELDLGAVPSR